MIFVTGYEQFGIKAIKHGAFDYILKPFSILEITNTVDKAKNRLAHFQLLHDLEKDSANSIKGVDEDRLAIKTETKKCTPLALNISVSMSHIVGLT